MEEIIYPDRKLLTKMIWIYLTITALLALMGGVLHLIIGLTGGDPEGPRVIWIIIGIGALLMWIIALPITILWIRNLSYLIRDDRVTIYKGILTKTQQNIPYRAVTDFILRRSLYDRALGIGSIRIQTAGQSQSSSGYEGNLAGVLEYDRWHDHLRDKLQSLGPLTESLTTKEPVEGSPDQFLSQILKEVRLIRKRVEK